MIFPIVPFKIISDCTPAQYAKIDGICDRFMTIDTVGHEESRAWQARNFHCLMTVAHPNGEALGYLELLPLTSETGPKLANGSFGETDIYPEHILDTETMEYAQTAYIAAIAVDKPLSYTGGLCALALVAACCKQLVTFYNPEFLQTIFVNPTTRAGFVIAKKFGFQPIKSSVSFSRNSHMHQLDLTPDIWEKFNSIYKRYARLIDYHPEK